MRNKYIRNELKGMRDGAVLKDERGRCGSRRFIVFFPLVNCNTRSLLFKTGLSHRGSDKQLACTSSYRPRLTLILPATTCGGGGVMFLYLGEFKQKLMHSVTSLCRTSMIRKQAAFPEMKDGFVLYLLDFRSIFNRISPEFSAYRIHSIV